MRKKHRLKSEELNISSEFSVFLTYFISVSNIYSRAFWASTLDVSQSAITQWIKGRTVPIPRQLNRILSLLNGITSMNFEFKEKVQEFFTLLDSPLHEGEKRKFKNKSTIGDYLLIDKIEELMSSITLLPFEVKNEFILYSIRSSNNILSRFGKELKRENIVRQINDAALFKDGCGEKENNLNGTQFYTIGYTQDSVVVSMIIDKFYDKGIYVVMSIINDLKIAEEIVNEVFEEIWDMGIESWTSKVICNFEGNIEIAILRICKLKALNYNNKRNNSTKDCDFWDLGGHEDLLEKSALFSKLLNSKEKVVLKYSLIEGRGHPDIVRETEIKTEIESITTLRNAKSKVKDYFIDT